MGLTEIELICQLLCEEKAAYLEYETHTQRLAICDIDEIELYVEQREALIKQINEMDQQIKKLCDKDEADGLLAYQAVKCKCDKEQLPERLDKIYDAGQEIFAVANRIRGMEPQILERLEFERANLLMKIKENNQSVQAKASKYYSPDLQEGRLLNSKYAKA
ncbi:hypothetical protein V6615_10545 [Oscillospiraceae bacterium PP1C4]